MKEIKITLGDEMITVKSDNTFDDRDLAITVISLAEALDNNDSFLIMPTTLAIIENHTGSHKNMLRFIEKMYSIVHRKIREEKEQ